MQENSQENPEHSGSLTEKVPPSLLELSSDLKTMFEKHLNPDLTLYIGEKAILCHRAILSARSKWFLCRIGQSKPEQIASIVINENELIMDALLLYMYTGNLCLIEDLNVPLLDLREAAAQFGLDKLKKLLTRILVLEQNPRLAKTHDLLWKVNVIDWKSVESMSPSLVDFSLDGTDKWYLRMKPICSSQAKYLGVYVKRVSTEPIENRVHIVDFAMHILDSGGKKRRSFVNVHVFKKDGETRMADEHISLCKLIKNAKDLLPNGILTLSLQLTFSAEDSASQTKFEIKPEIEKDVSNELHALSRDMYKLLRDEKFCDVSIFVRGSACLKVHSSILYARSLIPTALYGRLADLGCFGNIVWKSFVYYLYTGQTMYLADHMREIYVSVCKQQLIESQKKYSNIIVNNLTIHNVFDILSDATSFGDTELVHSVLYFIAHYDIIDNVMWSKYTGSYPNMAREIMSVTRHKKISLNLET